MSVFDSEISKDLSSEELILDNFCAVLDIKIKRIFAIMIKISLGRQIVASWPKQYQFKVVKSCDLINHRSFGAYSIKKCSWKVGSQKNSLKVFGRRLFKLKFFNDYIWKRLQLMELKKKKKYYKKRNIRLICLHFWCTRRLLSLIVVMKTFHKTILLSIFSYSHLLVKMQF